MVGQVFEDLYLLVEDLFGLWAIDGDYFDGKLLELPRLFIRPLDGTERSSTDLMVVQDGVVEGFTFDGLALDNFDVVEHRDKKEVFCEGYNYFFTTFYQIRKEILTSLFHVTSFTILYFKFM